MLDVLKQLWAGALGGGPAPGSPLENDLHESSSFASERLPHPFAQSRAFSQTLGLVATNHEAILRESLLNFANAQTATLPVTVVTTLSRVILETLSVQAWLIDPTVECRRRFSRWMALECQSERAAWSTLHPGLAHMANPIMRQLVSDADRLGIDRHPGPSPQWIGVNPPKSTTLAGALLQKYPTYANTGVPGVHTIGERFYRLFSGEMHGGVGSVLQLLLATGTTTERGHPVYVYGLSHGALWRAASIVFMSTFAARCIYAEWLGVPVGAETKRIHTHHVTVAIQKLM
jgi:hypothetical protein